MFVDGSAARIAVQGRVIYSSLDPFVTFEDQKPWFHDQQNPLYYQYVNGAILKSFVDQGVFKSQPPSVEDVIFADDIYKEMERLKQSTEQLFQQIDGGQLVAGNKDLSDKYGRARHFYEIYDYYDSERLAREILTAGK